MKKYRSSTSNRYIEEEVDLEEGLGAGESADGYGINLLELEAIENELSKANYVGISTSYRMVNEIKSLRDLVNKLAVFLRPHQW